MKKVTINDMFNNLRTVEIRGKKFKYWHDRLGLDNFGKDDIRDADEIKSIISKDQTTYNGRNMLKVCAYNAAYIFLSILVFSPDLRNLAAIYGTYLLLNSAAYTYFYALTKKNSKNMKELDKELEGEREIRNLKGREDSINRQIESFKINSQCLKASDIDINYDSIKTYLERNNIDTKYARELIEAGVFDIEVGYNPDGYERLFVHYNDDENMLYSCMRDFRGYSFMTSKYDIEESQDKIIVSENSFVRDEFYNVVGTNKGKTWYYDKKTKTVFEENKDSKKKKLQELKEQLIDVKKELAQKGISAKPMKKILKNEA